jgi:geranylgeranyl diphosphate synthase type II
MNAMDEFELLLEKEILDATKRSPEKLKEAIKYAVFPGGGRIRPRLGIGIAEAMGHAPERALFGSAMAIEMIHCASLVHDDLPCFDDAAMRRGKPSVQRQFGEDIAVLVGDALIVASFGIAAEYCSHRPKLTGRIIWLLSEAVGASNGIIAGQAAESDPDVTVREVHKMKTGALFEGMAAISAVTHGADPAPWRSVGRKVGCAYQVADDIFDAVGSEAVCGKPTLNDTANNRPSAVRSQSLSSAAAELDTLIAAAIDDIPPCPGDENMADMLRGVATRLCPTSLIPRLTHVAAGNAVVRERGTTIAGGVG